MKSLFLASALILASSASFASNEGIECPKIKLVCSHSVLSKTTHNYELKNSKEAALAGVNNDEPSLPANECESFVSFNSAIQANKTLRASLQGENSNQLMAYIYVGEGFGATNPQYSSEVTLNQTFNLHFNQEKLTCKVVKTSYSENY
jgi:hypothetical protein